MPKTKSHFRKDESLNRLADSINVAQFISYSPGKSPKQEYARVLGYLPNHKFKGIRIGLEELMRCSPELSLNVRSFTPEDPRSNEFLYGLTSVDDVEAAVRRIAGAGSYVIVNETVDVKDGGVSGVYWGGTVEFAPDDTPRCVEKPGVASLPKSWAIGMLQKVYGFSLDSVDMGSEYRFEFSIHPKPRGWKHTHVLGWELEHVSELNIEPSLQWPNQFSRHIGDKAYGLLLAAEIGLPVPTTTVISRRIAPFTFGKDTGSAERWIRTCPIEQVPGKFTTHHGWLDPFTLLATEDISGNQIASVLAQHAVPAIYSGALIVDAKGKPVIEGVRGEGEDLMKGVALPEELPKNIIDDVMKDYELALKHFGPVRFEWVHDGSQAWVVQLHRGATTTTESELVAGEVSKWRKFEVSKGLEALRNELKKLSTDEGIILIGQIGLTSHIADVVRKAGKPAKLNSSKNNSQLKLKLH